MKKVLAVLIGSLVLAGCSEAATPEQNLANNFHNALRAMIAVAPAYENGYEVLQCGEVLVHQDIKHQASKIPLLDGESVTFELMQKAPIQVHPDIPGGRTISEINGHKVSHEGTSWMISNIIAVDGESCRNVYRQSQDMLRSVFNEEKKLSAQREAEANEKGEEFQADFLTKLLDRELPKKGNEADKIISEKINEANENSASYTNG